MIEPLSPWVAISSGDLTAEINPAGAQLSILRDRADADLLWNGDPAVWAGRAPLLFPIVGAVVGGKYRLGTQSYSLARHGFARGSQFAVVQSAVDKAVFRLSSDMASLKLYPFAFELDVSYSVRGTTLTLTTDVRNLGEKDMPASFGYHPAFRWPLPYGHPRAEHYLEFENAEPAPVRRLDKEGLLSAQLHATPVAGRRLALNDTLFVDDVIIFDNVQSRSVSYGASSGPRLEIGYPDSPYLGIWTKPGAQFICIEPWHGIADPQGYSGDFTAKPGVVNIVSGASLQTTMTISLRA